MWRAVCATIEMCVTCRKSAAARRAPRAAARARRCYWHGFGNILPSIHFVIISVNMCAARWFDFLAEKRLRFRNRKMARLFGNMPMRDHRKLKQQRAGPTKYTAAQTDNCAHTRNRATNQTHNQPSDHTNKHTAARKHAAAQPNNSP